jgi:hypothetical protein
MAKIFEIKASLAGIKQEIYRTVRVKSSTDLQLLHEVFQALFAWENFHLHVYHDSQGREIKKEDRVALDQVLSNAEHLTYVYDYSDSWTLDISLQNSFDDNDTSRYPICIAGARKSPPEDSGGVTGYEMSLEMIGDEKKDFSLISEWYGDDYDPEHFDIDEINKALSNCRS